MPKGEPRRFRETILKQGPNPYVDIPKAVSRASARHERAGRIYAEGRLNGVFIQGTLIPAGKGQHKLYVNGGMRSAAGVGVGDTVSFVLRAKRRDTVRTSAGRCGRPPGPQTSSIPSHRRQLLRYVDDAKTAGTRERRIRRTVDHVLGREATAAQPSERSLWRCPQCGNEFVNRNQYHSCERHTLAVSNQQEWDTLGPERSSVRWRPGELPEGLVVTSASLDRLGLHLLPSG